MTSRLAYFVCLLLLLPMFAFAQNTEQGIDASGANNTQRNGEAPSASDQFKFQRQGVFGCNLNGAYAMSVGALSAVGGAYVPVNDAAVTLNTGYLVYKECVLDGVTKREGESAASAFLNQYVRKVQSLRLLSEDLRAETLERADQTVLDALREANVAPACDGFRNTIRTATVRKYLAETRSPNKVLTCSLPGSSAEQQAFLQGQYNQNNLNNYWGRFAELIEPQNRPFEASLILNKYIGADIATEEDIMRQQLAWGRGVYPLEEVTNQNGFTQRKTVTPSYLVSEGLRQVLGSGYEQLINATEIDQMIGALYAGLSTHIASDPGGLAGLTQRIGSQSSYLDQVARESAAGLRDSAVNAGLVTLNAARQIEARFLEIVNSTGQLLTNAINQLRAAENRCWDLIVPKATEYAQKGGFCTKNVDGTETCPSSPFQIQPATSTQFSQPIISTQISPYAITTAEEIQKAQNAVRRIEGLIAGLTNTNSLDAQRIALQQLDGMVARGELHTQNDLQTVQSRKEAVESAISKLVTDTLSAWGDSTDTNVGWCNINNPDVIKMWAERWRK